MRRLKGILYLSSKELLPLLKSQNKKLNHSAIYEQNKTFAKVTNTLGPI
jgi:hypothetical protein